MEYISIFKNKNRIVSVYIDNVKEWFGTINYVYFDFGYCLTKQINNVVYDRRKYCDYLYVPKDTHINIDIDKVCTLRFIAQDLFIDLDYYSVKFCFMSIITDWLENNILKNLCNELLKQRTYFYKLVDKVNNETAYTIQFDELNFFKGTDDIIKVNYEKEVYEILKDKEKYLGTLFLSKVNIFRKEDWYSSWMSIITFKPYKIIYNELLALLNLDGFKCNMLLKINNFDEERYFTMSEYYYKLIISDNFLSSDKCSVEEMKKFYAKNVLLGKEITKLDVIVEFKNDNFVLKSFSFK